MRSNPIPLITICLLVSFSSLAQDDSRYNLLLKTGTITPPKNITEEKLNQFNRNAARTDEKTFAIIQFEQLPTENEKDQLKQAGIELLDYIPNNAYTVTITGLLDESILLRTKARSVVELTPSQKMHGSISSGLFPAWAVKTPGTVDVWISFPKTFSFETVRKEFLSKNIDITNDLYKDYNILSLRIAAQRVFELASFPFVEYVQPAPGEDKPLNGWTNWNRDGSKATLLNAPLSVGGRDLKGTGVVIGVGDNSDPQRHPDFTGRLIDRSAITYNNMHGQHVAGTIGGAGIRDELRTGFAPKSTVISQVFAGIINNAPAYVTDYGMVITNNSYGNIDECSYHGLYDLYSRILDQQAFSLPNLENIFAAGNSGSNTCSPYPNGFRTVYGGYQSAKNVLTVGNAPPNGDLFATSSKGPVRDGRIKPEVITIGSYIMSCAPYPVYDYYTENTGTSMASPAVAGGAGLLYQRFRQLTGKDPKNALVKALICNGADDRGNDGPDFRHGFGFMNLWRSVNMMENNHIDSATITTAVTNSFVINVPAGLSKLKVMLVWNDPAAAVIASQALVNDLDLEVETPVPVTTVLPRILDTIPANVNLTAGSGADHINNIEQVTIDNPAAGDYTVKVKGTAVPQNSPQQYFVVYDYVPVDIKLVAPVGGDTYIPGERILIQWDSHGDAASTFTLEYSLNNGASWTLLDNAVPANIRYWTGGPDFGFLVGNTPTTEALIRVTKNATGASSTSFPFTILAQPVVTLAPDINQCEGYITINWTSVTAATDYEVMMLQGDEMISVATTAGNTYTFSGLSKDTTYWVTVRARMNSNPGRRAIAISRKPDTGSCNGTISDGDIKLDAIVSPASNGRLLTSTALGNNVPVTVRIKNLDDAPTVGNITVSYTLNAGAPVNEVITNPNIPGGSTLDYTFLAGTINMASVGSYEIAASASVAGDPVPVNNSLTKTFRQLDNPAITAIVYPAVFNDNYDAVPVQSYNRRQVGLTGLDRYDFVTSNDTGRIRTFINTGMAFSGNRALTLDAEILNSGNTDSLTGTFNLNTFNSSADDIRLDFRYKNHGQDNNAANKVWVRGGDTLNWVEAYDLSANQNEVDGTYKLSASIEVGDLLFNAAPSQNFATSFQVRWGQYGNQQAADNDGAAGYTFDNVRLYKVTDDMQMISIDAPLSSSCALTATTPVTITVRNSANTNVSNVPVRFRVDGGAFVPDELVPFIAANSTAQFTFTATADLSVLGSHLVEVRVAYPTDTYPDNDTLSLTLVNSPVITVTNSVPHLQNFESGTGNWYTGGKNNSWEYGTPASTKINRAASGSKAWKTRVIGNYNDVEKSYLYSPCYDISTVTSPTLSFSVALDLEDCGGSVACDGAYVEYSSDGVTWTRLGASGQGTNWYNRAYAGNNMWSVENYHRWHVATIPLPAGLSRLRLRIVMASDQSVNRDGIAVDDIHIYSNVNGIYDVTGTSPVANQPAVNGSNWINFIDIGTNKVIASVNPNGQNLGNTNVQSYINTGGVRSTNGQYYHDRNITIKPATIALADSATVRFYFLDTETEALINAAGCGSCYKPTTAYELGVSKYSDPDDNFENGTVIDDLQGNWLFINSGKAIKVPFDKGYYAEFKVKDFSEFWLNNGGFNNSQALPVQLISFTARKKNGKDVLTEWVTASENNVNRFEIEVAKGNSSYQQSQFVKIGEVRSQGNSVLEQRYSFTDIESGKTGVRYYRLKIIENDGSSRYSAIRPVVFDEAIVWQVYPNPSGGIFNLSFQANDGVLITTKIYDLAGKMVQQQQVSANGFVQKINIDLQNSKFVSGLYLLEASVGDQKQSFRLIKQ
ncbi:MAG: S8 family serine peptidase [Chitinophagaceae bacterium]